jgi:flagellar hook-basal body complex protein FliE
MIAPITNITPISMPDVSGLGKPSNPSSEFQNILSGTIDRLESLNHEASNAVQGFLTGQNEELHTVALATQKAELAFELGLQVRNKVVDAYQEIMKMPI